VHLGRPAGPSSRWLDGHLDGPDTGLDLEASEASRSDFAAFCDARVQASLAGWPDDNRVVVNTTTGDSLQMEYGHGPDRQPGAHLVNHQQVDYEAYPLYDAPGVVADLTPVGCASRMVRRRQHGEQVVPMTRLIDAMNEEFALGKGEREAIHE
jgi:hypothetical protein